MSNLQNEILDQYMSINQNPTLKAVSLDTGIQLTRVFRLLNGSKMRLEEFEVFEKRVKAKLSEENHLVELAQRCFYTLSKFEIEELAELMKRRVELYQLRKKRNFAESKETVA